MAAPPALVTCSACKWNCTLKCYAIHKDKFSCHQRTCRYHIGQPHTELQNNFIVPSRLFVDKGVPISKDDFQPEPVRLASNHPIVCMECTDKSCSYGCMEMHRNLSDSKNYYCHNRNCVNHTGTVHVSLDEKGGWIHSTRPKQRTPEPARPRYYRDPRAEYRTVSPEPDNRGARPRYRSSSPGPGPQYRTVSPEPDSRGTGPRYRTVSPEPRREASRTRRDENRYPPRPGVPRPDRRKSTDSYGRPPSPEPARPGAPRPARRKSTTTYGPPPPEPARPGAPRPSRRKSTTTYGPPPPPEPPRFTRERSRTRGEEAAARTRGERRRYEFVDPMDDLTGMFGTSWRPAAPGPPGGGASYRPAGFYPGSFSDYPPRYS